MITFSIILSVGIIGFIMGFLAGLLVSEGMRPE